MIVLFFFFFQMDVLDASKKLFADNLYINDC